MQSHRYNSTQLSLLEKIKNLLAKGTVDDMTRLVLVNAIYFKGDWDKKFNEANTKEMPFILNKVTAHAYSDSRLLFDWKVIQNFHPL